MVYQRLHFDQNTTSGILESTKPGLENRIWMTIRGKAQVGISEIPACRSISRGSSIPAQRRSSIDMNTTKPERSQRSLPVSLIQMVKEWFNPFRRDSWTRNYRMHK